LVGLYFKTALEHLGDAMAAKPFYSLGMTRQEIDEFMAKVRLDLDNPQYHSYFEYLFWTAQKPKTGYSHSSSSHGSS